METGTILKKTVIAPNVTKFIVSAADIAKKRKAGQFIILRVYDGGERIPLTIADADAEKGTITLISQSVGKTTNALAELKEGDRILDIAGPLGMATHIDNFGTVVCVAGGIGAAPLYPIAQAMKAAGNRIITILGARSKEFMILKDEMEELSDTIIVTTDDGSAGKKGFVTDALNELLSDGLEINQVVTIGPSIMMKMVSKVTEPHKIPTVASLNTIMVDGTGMCGGCRITVGGETKFVCVDGPEFDAHLVDWDEMMNRLGTYKAHECRAISQTQK